MRHRRSQVQAGHGDLGRRPRWPLFDSQRKRAKRTETGAQKARQLFPRNRSLWPYASLALSRSAISPSPSLPYLHRWARKFPSLFVSFDFLSISESPLCGIHKSPQYRAKAEKWCASLSVRKVCSHCGPRTHPRVSAREPSANEREKGGNHTLTVDTARFLTASRTDHKDPTVLGRSVWPICLPNRDS